MVEVAIFDFDGVIVDSFQDQFKWFKSICRILGKRFMYESLDAFRVDYREPVYPDMYEFLGFNWGEEKDVIWQEYNDHKANACIELVHGIDQVIKTLHAQNTRLAIVSSNTHEAINKQLGDHNLTSYFEVVVGKDDLPVVDGHPMLKPDPACILIALDKMDITPAQGVYIGDQPSDIIAARRVAEYHGHPMKVIAMLGGYSTEESLNANDPDELFKNPSELLHWFSPPTDVIYL